MKLLPRLGILTAMLGHQFLLNPAFSKTPSPCLDPSKTNAPQVSPLTIDQGKYSIEVCHLPETPQGEFKSEIRFKKAGKLKVTFLHTSDPTGGYVSRLEVLKKNNRFLAVSFDSGEFSNSILFFDFERDKLIEHFPSPSSLHECKIEKLAMTGPCQTTLRCEAQSKRRPDSAILKTIFLCKP